MESRTRLDRRERRQFRQLTKDLDIGSGFGEPPRPRHHVAKDALGAVVTLAVFGMILLEVTDGLASRCGAGPNSRAGACSGAAAFARHAQLPVTVSVAACGALAVLAFAWYLLWGYKTNAPPAGHREPLGSTSAPPAAAPACSRLAAAPARHALRLPRGRP